ncbi:MAG: hypothetical protein ACW976_04345 [Candidatus Ranarchaeia archaeon]|jgi:Zn finger protein HypA/HybF involved in hydrogenase expression
MPENKLQPYLKDGALHVRCLKCDQDAQMKSINSTTVELFCIKCGDQSFLIKKDE